MAVSKIASETWKKTMQLYRDGKADEALLCIEAAIEKALKAQADETKRCLEMVGGLGETENQMYHPRRPLDERGETPYLESDDDYFDNNRELILKLLEPYETSECICPNVDQHHYNALCTIHGKTNETINLHKQHKKSTRRNRVIKG